MALGGTIQAPTLRAHAGLVRMLFSIGETTFEREIDIDTLNLPVED